MQLTNRELDILGQAYQNAYDVGCITNAWEDIKEFNIEVDN